MVNMKSIWLLCAWLLLAGTVEAGEITCVKVEHNIPWYAQAECTDVPRSEPLTIDANGRLSVVDKCPQRMRAAMQAMDEQLDTIVRDTRPFTLREHLTHHPAINIYGEQGMNWDAVIKDCIRQ